MLLEILKPVARLILRVLFRIKVRGLEHFKKAGDRVLVIANHTSLLDAVLLVVFLPGRLAYAIDTRISQRWWIKPFLHFVDFCPMDPSNPRSLKTLISYLQQNRTVVIFPEGRMSVTGALMKIYQGPGMVVEKTGATLLPVYIEGAEYTPFTRLKGKVRRRLFPKINLTVMEPVRLKVPENVSGHARREDATRQMEDLMADMMFRASDFNKPLFKQLLKAREIHGGNYEIAEDYKREPLSYNQVILRSIILGRLIAPMIRRNDNVGVLLPTSNAALLSFFALHIEGCVPTLLNVSAGLRAIRNSILVAGLSQVITSREFVKQAQLESLIEGISGEVEVLYLEDLKSQVRASDKIIGLLATYFATGLYYRWHSGKRSAEDAAVVLFTSGSEGMPKGVVLSHANILSNYFQLTSRFAFGRTDFLLNVLPMFHSFGLTAGTLLPVFSGMKVFLYPTPLHYRMIPEIAYQIQATVMFGTNTFLNGYAKYAHSYDFFKIKYVFCGAEALSEQTRMLWFEKFGIRVYEGYGATETAPVLSANTPMHYRAGSVGRFMPGIHSHLAEVEGIKEGKLLMVKGPNIMKGYLLADNPGVLVPPETDQGAGWYDTGDIVSIDDDGFIFIKGRAKRFAKVGGEMVSLAAVEELAGRVWPNLTHAAITIPDPSKGEQIVLYTEQKEADRQALMQQARKDGISELYIPKKVIFRDSIPVMPTGKVDYQTLKEKHEQS